MNWLTSAKRRASKKKRKNEDQRITAWKRYQDIPETCQQNLYSVKTNSGIIPHAISNDGKIIFP